MIFLAATLPDYPTLLESLAFQVVGLAIVLIALTGLWLSIALVGAVFKSAEKTVPARGETTTPPLPTDLSPQSIAVIAAAIHASLEAPHRIVSIHAITPIKQPDPNLMAWSKEGRRQIFSSHQVR